MLPESRGDSRQPIDIINVVLSTVGILGVVYAVKGSGFRAMWPATAVAGAGRGLAHHAAFAVRQRRLTVPLLDFALFRVKAFAGAVTAEFM